MYATRARLDKMSSDAYNLRTINEAELVARLLAYSPTRLLAYSPTPMAHKKAGGSTSLGRDSQGQRLGVKMCAGEVAKTGNIIMRQRGTRIRAGLNVARAKDDSLFATANGIVKFSERRVKRFTNDFKTVKFANVIPVEKK